MRFISVTLTLLASLVASAAQAKAPADFTGVVVKVSDGDTLVVRRSDKSEVKVRLHIIDCPEVAHRRLEVGQVGGTDAVKAVEKKLLGKTVSVHPCGESYGRIVGDVSESDSSVALWLVANGHAMVDARYKPTKQLIEAQAKAKADAVGIWSQPNPIPPWEWRKMTRNEQIKGRKAK